LQCSPLQVVKKFLGERTIIHGLNLVLKQLLLRSSYYLNSFEFLVLETAQNPCPESWRLSSKNNYLIKIKFYSFAQILAKVAQIQLIRLDDRLS
jgi:hypothetical protein